MEKSDSSPQRPPLYSLTSLTVGTFFGGLVAAGIMLRKNYQHLGNPREGAAVMAAGIISTAFLLTMFFAAPDALVNNIVPLVYCTVVYQFARLRQGVALAKHARSKAPFFPGLKVVGVIAASLIITLVIAAGVIAVTASPNPDKAPYDKHLANIKVQEELALGYYEVPSDSGKEALVNYLKTKSIPAWKTCLLELDKMDQLQIEPEFKNQNKAIRHYLELRLEQSQLMLKSAEEDTDKYQPRLTEIESDLQ